ncbi:unnamed protein product [Closterium sp. Yama58-4]|nr:unnamed protein product [Closterium sp. Yama58-4]
MLYPTDGTWYCRFGFSGFGSKESKAAAMLDTHAVISCIGMEDKSVLLAHEAAFALGQMGDVFSVPALTRVLKDSSYHPIVRHEAAEALGAIGEASSLPLLQTYLADPAPEVRETCQLARFMSVDPAGSAPKNANTEELRKLLLQEDADMYDRYGALFALRDKAAATSNGGANAADGGADAASGAVADGNSGDGGGANAAVGAIVEALETCSSALLRHEIAYVLGQLQNKTAAQALVRALEDMSCHAMVRHEAAVALGSVADPLTLQLLRKFQKDPDPIVAESCDVALDLMQFELQPDAFQYADNARLQGLLDAERARLDAFFVGLRGLVDHLKELAEQVDDTEKYAAEQLRNAAEAMSQTITGNITGSFDEAWKTMKTFAEQASAWLEDFDNPEGNVAYQRALAVTTLADHVDKVVGDAQEDLREHITSQLSAAAVNIATAVTGRLPVQPPPPPQPTPPALPEELLKSFKADIMKTVTEATEQSFVASGMKMLTEMIGTVAPGRRGSSPSANDADAAQQRAADKQGLKRSGDGDDKESSKRSKGSDGSRVTKPPARSVVDMLKAKGWKVRGGSTSKGSGSGGADGRPADGIAANVDAPPGPPLDAEQTHPQASGGKDAAPTAQAAKVGGAGTTQGPSDAVPAKGKAMSASATVAGTGTAKAASASVPGTGKSKAASATVAGTTKSKAASGTVAGTTKSTPCNPPAATTGPAGQTGAGKHGEARAAPPAPAAPTAAKVDAKAASAQGPPGSNALRVLLHRMESHRPGAQQHHVVDAGLAEIARRSVTPHVAGKPSDAQSAARPVAAPPPADPKSAFLRAHIGARKAAAPPVTQPEPGTSATPTAVNATASSPGAAVVDLAAERGVSAALATGGRADRHAALESVLAQFEAAKRPEHAPALAIVDTAHAEPSATNTGGSAEPTAATGVVAEENAGRKGKDDTGKGKAVSAGKEMAEDKGKKPARKTGGKGKSAKKKEEEEKEEEEEEEVGEGEEHGRRGHGIRRDRSGDGQGWVGEMKFKNQNRYIGKSRDKMELAYEHAIAYSVYDGYVSKVLMKELTALKPGELDEWKAVWEEVKILPTGMWTVMWARGLCHPRARFDDILGRFRGYAGSGDALHGVLWPAMWFPIIEDTEEGRAETNANMSAMVNRVSMCAAYGKVAARVAYGKVDGSAEATAGETTDMEGADRKADEKVQMGAQALAASACALWCYMSTPASVLGAVGEGKAAAILAGAGKERGEHFAMVMHVVIEHARTRQAPAGEVAHNVAPELQRYGVARAFEAGIEEDEADMIARATVETLAFWGMCPLDGPKLKAEGIDVPCDAKMEYDLDHRGRKGEKVKQAKGSKRKR